jgi:hypothetical protein
VTVSYVLEYIKILVWKYSWAAEEGWTI